jgi:hypothetical protein
MCLGGRVRIKDKPQSIIPLVGAVASVTICDFVSEVQITQRYENKELVRSCDIIEIIVSDLLIPESCRSSGKEFLILKPTN